MKNTILISLLSFSLLNNLGAQELSQGKSKNSFIEWNLGVALFDENLISPGTSVLWGRTYINENNLIFEFEAGLAFPTIVTAKLGIGRKFNNTNVTIGVRPFPFNLYCQSSFLKGKKGYWITSIEFNPLDAETSISFRSRAILNFGYRWNLNNK